MQQKIVLVTGASSGFGRAIAQQLSCEGHIVFGTSRHATHADYCHILQMDVTCGASVAAGIAHIIDTYGRIDVVINIEMYSIMLSFGPDVKLLSPRQAVTFMAKKLRQAAAQYDAEE